MPLPLVATVVRVPLPRFAPRILVRRKMRAAAPAYEALPGLLYKAFLIGDDRTFGGLYLWTDRASAEARPVGLMQALRVPCAVRSAWRNGWRGWKSRASACSI